MGLAAAAIAALFSAAHLGQLPAPPAVQSAPCTCRCMHQGQKYSCLGSSSGETAQPLTVELEGTRHPAALPEAPLKPMQAEDLLN